MRARARINPRGVNNKNMKKIIIVMAIGFFVTSISTFLYLEKVKKPTEYIREEVTKEIRVDELENRINDAKNASSTEIEVRAKNAYEVAKRQAELEVELNVRTKYRLELEAKEKALMEEEVF